MINRIIEATPYWLHHIVVAIAIQLVVGLIVDIALLSPDGLGVGTASGIAFYVGREVRDRQKLGRWDWPGLVAPVVACLIVWACG